MILICINWISKRGLWHALSTWINFWFNWLSHIPNEKKQLLIVATCSFVGVFDFQLLRLLFLSFLNVLELKPLFYLLFLSFCWVLFTKPLFYLLFLLFLIVFVAKPYVLLVILVIVGFGELSLLVSLDIEEENNNTFSRKRRSFLLEEEEDS